MATSPKYDIPWELVSESLTGTLTTEKELQLQQWLSADPDNREKFKQIRELWENRLENYRIYKLVNEEEAWKALRVQLEKSISRKPSSKSAKGELNRRPALVRNLIAIAAVFIGLVGIGTWFMLTSGSFTVYETGAGMQKKIALADGTTITLQPLTRLEVSHDYNKTSRTIVMTSGEAYFDVSHRKDKPFMVELGKAQVKDIGTSFSVKKGKQEINVAVASGKVAFVKLATREVRELTAGKSLTFDLQKERFGEIEALSPSSKVYEQMLNFDNTPLSDVVDVLQKVYGKKILMQDAGIANKKITAKLGGMPCNLAIKVICKSLKLEYAEKDSVYVLKERNKEQP